MITDCNFLWYKRNLSETNFVFKEISLVSSHLLFKSFIMEIISGLLFWFNSCSVGCEINSKKKLTFYLWWFFINSKIKEQNSIFNNIFSLQSLTQPILLFTNGYSLIIITMKLNLIKKYINELIFIEHFLNVGCQKILKYLLE